MPELFETTQIPDDLERWDALAERVAGIAARQARQSGLAWLATSRAGWVVASLLLAAAVTFIMLPAEQSPAKGLTRDWVQVLAPADDVGKAIAARDGPPPVGALLMRPR